MATKSSNEQTLDLLAKMAAKRPIYTSHIRRLHFHAKNGVGLTKAVRKLLNKISLNISTRLDVITTTVALQDTFDSFSLKKMEQRAKLKIQR